jgi:hypothetical protein
VLVSPAPRRLQRAVPGPWGSGLAAGSILCFVVFTLIFVLLTYFCFVLLTNFCVYFVLIAVRIHGKSLYWLSSNKH